MCLLGCSPRGALTEIYLARHLNAGIAALQRGKGKEAVSHLERVASVRPGLPEADLFLGRAYVLAKQYRKAIPRLERQPADQRTLEDWFVLADAYDHADRVPEAEAAYRRALRLAGPSALPVALNNLGYMLATRKRKLDEALTLIRAADRRAPDRGFIVDSLAWVHYQRGEYKEAEQAIARACALSPDEADLRYHQGMILLKLGRRQSALGAFAQAVLLNPDHADAKKELRALGVDPARYVKQAKGWRQRWRRWHNTVTLLSDKLGRGLF